MYNRTPRMGVLQHSQTPSNVGPTTYIICEGREKIAKCVPVAFLSTEPKHPSFLTKSYCDTFYTLPTDKIKGGLSPRNRANRFVYQVDDTPVPGQYDLSGEPKLSKKVGKGKLYLCKVPFTLKGSGPSIPTRINENGYSLDAEGNVTKMPPDFHDTNLGPASYNIMQKSSYYDRYRGCKWSARTGKRPFFDTADNPSPADYDVKVPKCQKEIENERFREMARLLSYVPRFLDAQEIKSKKDNLPSPAHYETFKSATCQRCEGIYPRPFINGSKRFKKLVSETPSPDSYNILNNKYSVSKTQTPFLVGTPRFPQDATFSSPGPSDYSIKSPMEERLRQKCNEFALHQVPFNKSSPRQMDIVNKDALCAPSPAEYTIDREKSCKIFVSSIFKSKVKRFPKLCSKMHQIWWADNHN